MQNNTSETWRDIDGYEGYYQVSNTGNVRGVDRVIMDINQRIYKIRGRAKTPQQDKYGYWCVLLSRDGKNCTKKVHRLVAEAFIPNPDNKPQINHKNGIRTDNRVENLEHVTCRENLIHSFHKLCRKNPQLGMLGAQNHASKPIMQFDREGEFVAEYAGIHEAQRETGILNSGICRACTGKAKTAGGYIWKHKDVA